MATKKIVINDETKHKLKKIVKAAVPCVIGGAIAASIGVIFYKKGHTDGWNDKTHDIVKYLSDHNHFSVINIEKPSTGEEALLGIAGNIFKSEDDIVTFLSNRYHNGNPDPETMEKIVGNAKRIMSTMMH